MFLCGAEATPSFPPRLLKMRGVTMMTRIPFSDPMPDEQLKPQPLLPPHRPEPQPIEVPGGMENNKA
jgi:hypothetical protein